MQLLKRHKRDLTLAGIVLATLVALVIIAAPSTTPAAPKASVGEILGTGSRGATAQTGGAALTDSQIAAYQDKLKVKSDDTTSNARLGLAYLQKAREVSDPTYYGKAEAVFKKALEIDPKNAEAMGGLGSLALSRHQFAEALDWGRKAQEARPGLSYNYGVVGDALVELGRYDEAVQVVQQMVDMRPDVSSYARVSYLRELYGKYDGAIEAMQEAVAAGGPTLENRAWVTYQLGMLYFNKNDLAQAEASFNQALLMMPDYVYGQAGLARIKAAKGDLEGAISLYAKITQRIPLTEFIIEYGDMLNATGKTTEAGRQYDLVRAIQKIYTQNGVNTDMEMALFDADHQQNLPLALEHARQQVTARPSIKASDVLAWTLYQTGDYAAARETSQKALRLGTQDALSFFHAGMIASKLGQTDEARTYLDKALSINPNFSFLHASEARKTLAGLGGPVAAK